MKFGKILHGFKIKSNVKKAFEKKIIKELSKKKILRKFSWKLLEKVP